ncbi:MAG TPA: fatty acid--CoA ligase [Blastocatellia bacterium]|nr:fatty acid--CoA ligase [Blastocatellia bacterium]
MSDEVSLRLVADIARHQSATRPRAVAMVFNERATTYGELDRLSNQTASGLIAEGLSPQTRIAVLDKNSDSFFEILFGAAKSNNVMVAINWRLAAPEISYIINDAMAEVLFVGEEYFGTIEKLLGDLKTVKKIIALNGSHEEWESYQAWRDRQSETDPDVSNDPSDVVLQMYTSGTTGHPKGAQLTNSNLLTIVPVLTREFARWDESDVSLVCMPLFHIGGSGYALMGFYSGARNIILRETVPAAILQAVSRHRVTKAFLVPALLLFLLQTPGVQDTDFSSLNLIIYGASPIPLDLLRRSMETFKCGFAQTYGLTETSGGITWLPPEDHDPNGNERMRSCGKPHSLAEIRVVDATGRVLPVGEVGEIICRSPQNMKGYWNLPDATASTVRGEWLHTGDAGYLDADGYIYIHDRVKDLIVSGGENIYPAEVESVLFGHPAIADVAVIGVPDDTWGEAVKAVVVKKPGAEVTAEEIMSFARERIAHFKAPRSVDFVAALPRNPSGKILKRELRAPFWEGRERQVN